MYKAKKRYLSPNVGTPPMRDDFVAVTHEDGTQTMEVTRSTHQTAPVKMSDALDAHDLGTQLKAGILPREVNCLLTPQTGEGMQDFVNRAHNALTDFIVNAETRIAEQASQVVEPTLPLSENE